MDLAKPKPFFIKIIKFLESLSQEFREYPPLLFDDWRSWLHFAYGLTCPWLPPWLQLLTAALFSLYEWLEPDRPTHKAGDVLEFLLGYLIGLNLCSLIHTFTGVSCAYMLNHLESYLTIQRG